MKFIKMALISVCFAVLLSGADHRVHQGASSPSHIIINRHISPHVTGEQAHPTFSHSNRRVDHDDWRHGRHHHDDDNGFVTFYPYGFQPAYYDQSTISDDYTNQESTYDTTNASNPSTAGNWVYSQNGAVPNDAIPYQNQDGVTFYRCRAHINEQIYYGQLFLNDACYIEDGTNSATIRFDVYEVLVQ